MIYVKTARPSARGMRHALGRLVRVAAALAGAATASLPAQAQSAAEQPQRLQAITLGAGMHNIRADGRAVLT